MTKEQRAAQARFHRSVNMTAAAIRAWTKDPRAKEASWAATLRRLPALAALKAKPRTRWTLRDFTYARRVVAFNDRMSGAVRVHGCTRKAVISLRNWGRQPPRCRIPPKRG